MTSLEQAKKLDTILTMYLENERNGIVELNEISKIYPSIFPTDLRDFLVGDGMLMQNKLYSDNWRITAKGKLHLDAGGYAEIVEYRHRIDTFVVKVGNQTLWYTKATFILAILAVIKSFYGFKLN